MYPDWMTTMMQGVGGMMDPASAMAAQAAAQGVPPPAPLGASMEPMPLPTARPQMAAPAVGAPLDLTPPNPTPVNPQPAKPVGGGLQSLRGVQAPAAPELQRISTPPPPRPTSAVKGGELLALLQMLQQPVGPVDRKLPSTLGAAIGR